jgi:hypothetical protein
MPTDIAALAAKMHESVDLSDPKEVEKFNGFGFGSVGDTYIALRQSPTAELLERSNGTLEIGPKGMVVPPRDDFGLHVVYSGTPHHTRHLFGYWHINDVDEAYVKIPGSGPEELGTLCIFMRHPRPGERDMFAWYCEECVTLLFCHVFDSGNTRPGDFIAVIQAEDEAIRTFNSDRSLRICKECGTEHPLAYRFWEPNNSAEEEAARALW